MYSCVCIHAGESPPRSIPAPECRELCANIRARATSIGDRHAASRVCCLREKSLPSSSTAVRTVCVRGGSRDRAPSAPERGGGAIERSEPRRTPDPAPRERARPTAERREEPQPDERRGVSLGRDRRLTLSLSTRPCTRHCTAQATASTHTSHAAPHISFQVCRSSHRCART